MKKVFSPLFQFFKDLPRYAGLVFLFNLFVTLIAIPLLLGITHLLMNFAGIKVLQLDLVGGLILRNPISFVGFLLILYLILILLYLEFSFLIYVVYLVRTRQKARFRQLILLSFSGIRQLRPATLGFLLVYFLIILPFSGLGDNIPIASNIKIPNFVAIVLETNGLYVFVILLSTALAFYLTYRFIFVLPALVLRREKLGAAIKSSWEISKKRFWIFVSQIAILSIGLALMSWLAQLGFLALQTKLDKIKSVSLTSATIILLILVILVIVTGILTLMSIFYLTGTIYQEAQQFPESIPLRQFKSRGKTIKWGLRVISGLLLLFLFFSGVIYFQNEVLSSASLSNPMIISHRGVSNDDGVQNTIPALEKTSSNLKPDLVEMDIRQTKDKEFLVYHDANTKGLTGVDKTIAESTLVELTQLTAKENNQAAPLPSFDQYLTKAESLHQKLLVEIKTDKSDDISQVLDNFLSKYRDRLIKDGDSVHSLNFDLVEAFKQKAPEIPTYYTMAYNFVGVPKTSANGFSAEISSLDSNFVSQAHAQNKKVNSWNTNDPHTVNKMRLYQVDGLITDNIKLVRRTMTKSKQNIPYSQHIQIYISDLSNNRISDIFTGSTQSDDA